jgi:uncharacterized protein with von Willebrand factor type A (vWA) domain
LARALRAGGVRLGAGALLDANAALAAVGPAHRADVRAALLATLVRDPSDLHLFEWLFEAFYPRLAAGAPADEGPVPTLPRLARPAARRACDGLAPREDTRAPAAPCAEAEASGTESDVERLRTKDFEQMSAAELATLQQLIPGIARAWALRRSRRSRTGITGRHVDLRAMVRRNDLDQPRYRSPRPRPRDCVLLVDISGSMSVYSRVFLQFAHALTRCPGRVEIFVFATRLSRITRALRQAEPDLAMAAATRVVSDWDGGTRLGACLADFNRRWARSVLASGPRVVLLSDGLERDAIDLLGPEVRRLKRAAHELIWVNPLLRSREYAPLAAGARVLSAHADVRPAHNLVSLADLSRILD